MHMRAKNIIAVAVAGIACASAYGFKTNYVDCMLADYTGHDGTSWTKAFKTIQEGVEAAVAGDLVLVAPQSLRRQHEGRVSRPRGLPCAVECRQRQAVAQRAHCGACAPQRISHVQDMGFLEESRCPGMEGRACRNVVRIHTREIARMEHEVVSCPYGGRRLSDNGDQELC